MNKPVLLLLFLSLPAFAAGSGGSGNGGDLVGNAGDGQVIEFRNLGLAVAEKLEDLNGSCRSLLPVNALDLVKVIYRARIESSETELTLGGRRVEAINYPAQMQIVFHLPSFRANTNKRQFVIHEFLGLLNVADTRGEEQYGLSKFLISLSERAECQSPLSARKWLRKQASGEKVYFQFKFPDEILAYDLATQSQVPAPQAPAGAQGFALYGNAFYFGQARAVCNAAGSCLPGSEVPQLLHDFGLSGDLLLESVMGVRDSADFLEMRYDYDNLQAVDLRSGAATGFRLATFPADERLQPWEKFRYALPRTFRALAPGRMAFLADQYSGDHLDAFSVVALERLPGSGGTTRVETRRDGTSATIEVSGAAGKFRITQRFFFPSESPVPQDFFPVRNGKFLLADDGSVFNSASLAKVAMVEAPVIDAAEYGDYTVALSSGRLLIYDQDWHLQGEFTPSVKPGGLAVRGETIYLFSMLTDNRLFTEMHDMGEFFKRKRPCLMNRESLAAFHPQSTFPANGSVFALAAAEGCVLRQEGSSWTPWMGLLRNPAGLVVLAARGQILAGDSVASLFSLDLASREETLIASFARELVSMKAAENNVELVLHTPGTMGDYLRRVTVTPEGRILSDYEFWNRGQERK